MARQLSNACSRHQIAAVNFITTNCEQQLPAHEQLNGNEMIVSAPTFDARRCNHPITCTRHIITCFMYSGGGSSQPITLSLLWLLTLSFLHARLGFLSGEPRRSMLSSLIKQWLFSPFQMTSCQGLWF